MVLLENILERNDLSQGLWMDNAIMELWSPKNSYFNLQNPIKRKNEP